MGLSFLYKFPLPGFTRLACIPQVKTGKKSVSPPALSSVSGGAKRGEKHAKNVKSGKSELWYAKERETHNNADFYSFLYFFSRIRTHVLAMAEKNLYISQPKPGTAPKPGKRNVTNL